MSARCGWRQTAGDRQPPGVDGPGGRRRPGRRRGRTPTGASSPCSPPPACWSSCSPCPSSSGAPASGSTWCSQPERVIAGGSVAAGVRVRNIAAHGLLPTMLELPVGSMVHRYGVPRLGPDETHEESFTIRTERRGVIPVGPATTRRGDPLAHALARRRVDRRRRDPGPPADGADGLARRRPAPRPRGRLDRRGLPERPGLPRAARVRPRRRPAPRALAVVGQGDGGRRRQPAARPAVPRHPAQPRHARRRRPRRACGPTPRTSRPPCRSPRRSSSGPRSTSSTPRSSAGPALPRASTGHLALDSVCRADFGTAGLVSSAHRAAVVSPDTSLLFLVGGAATRLRELPARGRGLPARGTPLRPDRRPRRASRVTETGGLVVVQVADKADLGALLRWSARVAMRYFRRLTLGQARRGRRSTPRSCSR